jgi:hypothetical protein
MEAIGQAKSGMSAARATIVGATKLLAGELCWRACPRGVVD